MQIDIVSDTVCPWCYIGKKRLEKALALWEGEPITVEWHPFQLDASIPPEGVDQKEYMAKRFGPDAASDRFMAARNAIADAGRELGIDFHFDLTKVRANTLNSHRLIRWAGTAGRQDAVVDALFRRHFTEGQDIGDVEVLIEAAAEAGMDADIVRGLLASEADKELVEREEMQARSKGIQSVPSFVVNKKWMLVGAQDSETMLRAFEQIAAQGPEAEAS